MYNSHTLSSSSFYASVIGEHNTTPLVPQGDVAVQGTTDEAASSKLSAANLGYFVDPYLKHFVKKPTRRAPLINRGYYCRVATFRRIVREFVNSAKSSYGVQIVNLGAGLDTLFFWVNDNFSIASFFEVDFPEVLSRKASIISRTEELWKKLVDVKDDLDLSDGMTIRSPKLKMIPVDMRDLNGLDAALKAAGFRTDIPTLFLAECVFVYMHPTESDKLIAWASKEVTAESAIAVFEQINPHDAFGMVMIKNLENRGCPLLGLKKYSTIEEQRNRFIQQGWPTCVEVDMNDMYDKYLDREDVTRTQRLEIFDEIEEWRLIQAHYVTIIATHPSRQDGSEPSEGPLSGLISQMSSHADKI